jgi:hypothetical protein
MSIIRRAVVLGLMEESWGQAYGLEVVIWVDIGGLDTVGYVCSAEVRL